MTAPPAAAEAPGPALGGARRRLLRWTWATARAAALAALAALAAWRLDWAALGDALGASAWHLVIAAGLAGLASSVFKGMTWQGIVDALPEVDGRSRPSDIVRPLLVGALLNSFLVARLGDVAKVVLGRRRLRRRGLEVSTEAMVGTMVSEHVVATAVWGALALAASVVLPMPAYAQWTAAGLGAGAVAGFALGALVRPRPGPRGRGAAGVALRCVGRSWTSIHSSSRGLAAAPGRAAYVLAAACGQWVAAWVAALAALSAVGLADAGPAAAAVVVVTLTVAHALPISPGNVGTFQVAAALPLTLSFGASPAQAVAFGIVLQASEMAANVLGGLGCLAAEALEGSPQQEASPQSETVL